MISLMNAGKRKLIITTDPIGGAKATSFDGFDSIGRNSTVVIEVGSELPNILYYQDSVDPMIGGLIIIDKQLKERHHSNSYRTTETDFDSKQ